MLTINSVLLPIGVTVGNPAVTTVTIVDNVGKGIYVCKCVLLCY